jgi:hypothetical protein
VTEERPVSGFNSKQIAAMRSALRRLKDAIASTPKPIKYMKAEAPGGGLTVVGLDHENNVLIVIHPGHFTKRDLRKMKTYTGLLP